MTAVRRRPTHRLAPASTPAGSAAAGPVADTVDPATHLHSALYEGVLSHARSAAEGSPSHAFTYRVLMAWLDLAELPHAFDAHPFWSATHAAPMRFRRSDFHGDPAIPLDDAVRTTAAAHLGYRPTGPIRMLAHLRTWGWSFNPIVFYFVFSPDDSEVEALVAEVTNTPWHERHAYVMPVHGPDVRTAVRFPKALHVSPFMDMDLDHAISFTRPGAPVMTIRMDDWREDERTFAATLRLDRKPLDRPTMGVALRRHPVPAQKVSAGIYLEALKLRLKGAPFRHHPAKASSDHRSSSATPAADQAATPTSSPRSLP